MARFHLSAALLAASGCQYADAEGATSRLQVILPKDLRKSEGGYDHREATFGLPPYGGSIQQNVYYANSTLCATNIDYTRGGYPARDTDETGDMAPWKTPFILMIDRGDCTFVKKARNAQRSGAAGMIIADNTCLCNSVDACTPLEGDSCESNEPVMADDGSGSDISIPSFLMFKQDADPIKETLMKDIIVRMDMAWSLPRPDARVEYELWTTPRDLVSRPLQHNFRDFAVALGEYAQFTPHMYFYDGLYDHCRNPDLTNNCFNLCTNNGRYCSADPDGDMDKGASGADLVTESLRRLCIWQEYGKDGIGVPFWDYFVEFLDRCDSDDAVDDAAVDGPVYFTSIECIKDAMKHSNIEFDIIQSCMDDAGGVESGDKNTILQAELESREQSGVVILPSFFVNKAQTRGALTPGEVFEAICSSYAPGSEPTICTTCMHCDDAQSCVSIGHCPGAAGSMDTVSMPFFVGSFVAVFAAFMCLGLCQYQRTQRQMRHEVRGILAQYMPLDKTNNAQSVGLSEDDEDTGIELS